MISRVEIEELIDLWEADMTFGEVYRQVKVPRIDAYCVLFVGVRLGMSIEMI